MSKVISRRTVVRGLGSLLAPHSSARSIHSDEVLLGACAEFQGLASRLRYLVALPAGTDKGDKALMQILDSMDRIEPLILGSRSVAPAGLQAKARIVSWIRDGQLGDDPDACLDDRLVASMLRDLLERE